MNSLFEEVENKCAEADVERIIVCDVDALCPRITEYIGGLDEGVHDFLLWARDEKSYDIILLSENPVEAAEDLMDWSCDITLYSKAGYNTIQTLKDVSDKNVALIISGQQSIERCAVHWNPKNVDVLDFFEQFRKTCSIRANSYPAVG